MFRKGTLLKETQDNLQNCQKCRWEQNHWLTTFLNPQKGHLYYHFYHSPSRLQILNKLSQTSSLNHRTTSNGLCLKRILKPQTKKVTFRNTSQWMSFGTNAALRTWSLRSTGFWSPSSQGLKKAILAPPAPIGFLTSIKIPQRTSWARSRYHMTFMGPRGWTSKLLSRFRGYRKRRRRERWKKS